MLYGKKHKKNNKYVEPIFGSEYERMDIPLYTLNGESIDPKIAYRLVKDELIDEGNARQNLATFCQTYMEDEAVKLMSETMEKNAIDKSEYPKTTELENRCVNILASLWNVQDDDNYLGTSTVGSSEACMLGGIALKFSWRNNAIKSGLDINIKKPNLVISSGYQVCWEKFCVYWDIELRTIPMDINNLSIDPKVLLDYVDEYTIGVVGILGITYTGKFDNIKAMDEVIEEYNKVAKIPVYIHVDGASGAMFTPFIQPNLVWDFRLKNVVSINTSGHKYGLVYPGIGWVLWKDEKYLPKELIFEVKYLGGTMPTMAINFSRSASQIIGQYYNFLRFGFEGYKEIHQKTKDVALYLAHEVDKTGYFDIINDGDNLPIVCYKMKENIEVNWTLFDLSDHLLMKGWQVPSYPMPKNIDNIIIQRYVCRADLGFNMAVSFIEDFIEAINTLNNKDKSNKKSQGFTH